MPQKCTLYNECPTTQPWAFPALRFWPWTSHARKYFQILSLCHLLPVDKPLTSDTFRVSVRFG